MQQDQSRHVTTKLLTGAVQVNRGPLAGRTYVQMGGSWFCVEGRKRRTFGKLRQRRASHNRRRAYGG